MKPIHPKFKLERIYSDIAYLPPEDGARVRNGLNRALAAGVKVKVANRKYRAIIAGINARKAVEND